MGARIVVSSCLALTAGYGGATGYFVTRLDIPLAANTSFGKQASVNAAGDVVVAYTNSEASGNVRYTFTYINGIVTDFSNGPLGRFYGSAINSSGAIAGFSDGTSTGSRGHVRQGATFVELAGNSSSPNAINELGETTGRSSQGAIRWAANGTATVLGSGEGMGINASGVVAGEKSSMACYWDAGGLHMIPTGFDQLGSVANDVNDSGMFVGNYAIDNRSNSNGFVYLNGVFTNVGTHGLNEGTWLNAVNNSGQAVGGYHNGVPQIGILWEQGTLSDLNDLVVNPIPGFSLQAATDIGDGGHIVGFGFSSSTGTATYLLTPVPEPGTLLLLGLGSAALLRRRRGR